MPADNTVHLITAAHHRHELTRAKAIRALRELDQAGTPITFELVARTADVSRSWLYSQPDIRDQIQRLRCPASRRWLRNLGLKVGGAGSGRGRPRSGGVRRGSDVDGCG